MSPARLYWKTFASATMLPSLARTLEQLTCDLKMTTKQFSYGKLKNDLQKNTAKQCEQITLSSTLFDVNRFSGKSDQSNKVS